MAGQSSQDALQQTVDAFASRIQDYANGIAGRLGQPMSGTQLSRDEAVQRWNFSPLGSTSAADAAYHQLVGQGTPPGQALEQVYPMRSMLYQGADLKDAISTAQQIQGWAAEAAGQPPPPKPEGSTMPLALAQQRAAASPAAAPSGPVTPSPLPAPPMPPVSPLAQAAPPMPPPPVPSAPAPGMS